jgi:ABC-type dipeptide/oligopeptide/nickel transport system permease component
VLLLAILLIASHSLGVLTRVYRRGLLAAGAMPFMQTALAKGLSRRQALWRHGQRHALLALLSAVRSEAAWAVGTSATMEVLFGLPGISRFLVDSIAARDYAVLQAYVMIVALWMLVLNAVVAMVVGRLDPRPE